MRFMDAAPLQTNRVLSLILEHCARLNDLEHTPPSAVLRLRHAAGDELARLLLAALAGDHRAARPNTV